MTRQADCKYCKITEALKVGIVLPPWQPRLTTDACCNMHDAAESSLHPSLDECGCVIVLLTG